MFKRELSISSLNIGRYSKLNMLLLNSYSFEDLKEFLQRIIDHNIEISLDGINYKRWEDYTTKESYNILRPIKKKIRHFKLRKENRKTNL